MFRFFPVPLAHVQSFNRSKNVKRQNILGYIDHTKYWIHVHLRWVLHKWSKCMILARMGHVCVCSLHIHARTHTRAPHEILLLLISMLWHRQAIFESKGDKCCLPLLNALSPTKRGPKGGSGLIIFSYNKTKCGSSYWRKSPRLLILWIIGVLTYIQTWLV